MSQDAVSELNLKRKLKGTVLKICGVAQISIQSYVAQMYGITENEQRYKGTFCLFLFINWKD